MLLNVGEASISEHLAPSGTLMAGGAKGLSREPACDGPTETPKLSEDGLICFDDPPSEFDLPSTDIVLDVVVSSFDDPQPIQSQTLISN